MIDTSSSYQNATQQAALTTNVKSKSDEAFGLKLAQQIQQQLVPSDSYFQRRNIRFSANRISASGKIDVRSKFRDVLNMGGERNFANLNWKALLICNTIIARLVGRWKLRKQKIQVTAIDAFSKEQKKENIDNATFILDHKEMLGQAQDVSGVPMIGKNDFVPEDQDDLDTFVIEGNRMPEEINYELATNNIFALNGWNDVILDKYFNDSAVVGLIGAYSDMDAEGIVTPQYLIPENCFYSYSSYADFRDTVIRGHIKSFKLSELREKYSSKYTEEDFFELAKTAKQWNANDKMQWLESYTYCFSRPYDDWNIDCFIFEYKTYDTDVYKKKETKSGSLIIEKSPDPKDKQGERISRDKWNIYEGVYAQTKGLLLSWDIQDRMIRSQDPKEIGQAEFRHSFYMYDMQEMINVAVPEKIEAQIEALQLDILKIQQCIAISRPPGAAINIDAAGDLDLGLASGISSADEVGKIFDQTGKLFYRGRDAAGHQIPVPIQELTNSGFLNQIQGYIQTYQFHFQALKDQLGEDPNLINAAATPRVSVGNIQTAQSEAAAATDYMYYAVMRLYEDVSKKVACLLNDSITYGAKAYRNILKEKEVKNRVFATVMEELPNEGDIQRLDSIMQNAIANTQGLAAFLNPYKILQQAKQNIKLANLEYTQALKKFSKAQQEEAQQNQQATFQAQAQSNQQAAQAKLAQTQMEGNVDMAKSKTVAEGGNKTAIINMVANLIGGGLPIPPQYAPFINAALENVMLPMVAENEQQKQQIIQQMQALTNPQPQQQDPQGMPQAQESITPEQQQPQQAA